MQPHRMGIPSHNFHVRACGQGNARCGLLPHFSYFLCGTPAVAGGLPPAGVDDAPQHVGDRRVKVETDGSEGGKFGSPPTYTNLASKRVLFLLTCPGFGDPLPFSACALLLPPLLFSAPAQLLLLSPGVGGYGVFCPSCAHAGLCQLPVNLNHLGGRMGLYPSCPPSRSCSSWRCCSRRCCSRRASSARRGWEARGKILQNHYFPLLSVCVILYLPCVLRAFVGLPFTVSHLGCVILPTLLCRTYWCCM